MSKKPTLGKGANSPFLILLRDRDRVLKWAIVHRGRRWAVHAKGDNAEGALEELMEFAKEYGRLPVDWEPKVHIDRTARSIKVYFISTDDVPDFPIKIGKVLNNDVEARMAMLQCGMPYRLKVLGVEDGDWEREGNLHIAFAHVRIPGGEWFRRSPDLLKYIAKLNRGRQ